MATKGKIETEMRREKLIVRYEQKRQLLKDVQKTSRQGEISMKKHLVLLKKIHNLPRNSAPTRHRNRCWATGRSRGFYRDFGLSRHALREMGNEGLIPGFKRSSW